MLFCSTPARAPWPSVSPPSGSRCVSRRSGFVLRTVRFRTLPGKDAPAAFPDSGKGHSQSFRFSPTSSTYSAAFGRDKPDYENFHRRFCTGADHHRLRSLFGHRVDQRKYRPPGGTGSGGLGCISWPQARLAACRARCSAELQASVRRCHRPKGGERRCSPRQGSPRYQRFRFITELRSLLSTLLIDPPTSLGFCPMLGSDGFRLVFERSLLLLLKLSVAPRSKAPLVVTSDGPPIELPTTKLPGEPPEAPPCANASVELRDIAVTSFNILNFMLTT